MATRFRLPSSGTPGLSPALRIAWTHTPGTVVRLPMSPSLSGTAFATTTYTPDASDHLVAGSAHIAQFISAPLAAQTIGVQTVQLTMLCSEAHQNNNLFLHWTVYAVTAADALVGTLVAARSDATEVATSLTNRTDSATSSSVTVGDGDRLVFEVGFSGTPAATGGVQGHNGSIRFGDAGSDLAANDSATTDGNPWLELATTTLTFMPTTSGTAAERGAVRAETAAAKGGASAPSARAAGRLATVPSKPVAGTADWTGISGQSLTPTLPTGWQADDVFVLVFTHNANGAMASLSGWTQLLAQDNTAGQRVEVWWRRAQAGDTDPTVSLATNTVTTVRGARIYGIRGCPTPDDPFDGSSTSANASSATVTFSDITTTVENDFVLALVAYANDPTDVSTMANFTEPADAVSSFDANPLGDDPRVLGDADNVLGDGGSGAAMLGYEWRATTTPGAAGASSLTVSGGTFSNAVNVGILLAIKTNVAAQPATSGTAAPAGRAQLATAGAKASSATAAIAGRAVGTVSAVKGGAGAGAVAARSLLAAAATRSSTGTAAQAGRVLVAATPTTARAGSVAIGAAGSLIVSTAEAGVAAAVAAGRAFLAASGLKSAVSTADAVGDGSAVTTAQKASMTTVVLAAPARLASEAAVTRQAAALIRAGGILAAVSEEAAPATSGSVEPTGRAVWAVSAAKSAGAAVVSWARHVGTAVTARGSAETTAVRGQARAEATAAKASVTTVAISSQARLLADAPPRTSDIAVIAAAGTIATTAAGRNTSASVTTSARAILRTGAEEVARRRRRFLLARAVRIAAARRALEAERAPAAPPTPAIVRPGAAPPGPAAPVPPGPPTAPAAAPAAPAVPAPVPAVISGRVRSIGTPPSARVVASVRAVVAVVASAPRSSASIRARAAASWFAFETLGMPSSVLVSATMEVSGASRSVGGPPSCSLVAARTFHDDPLELILLGIDPIAAFGIAAESRELTPV